MSHIKKINIGEQPKEPEKETIFIQNDGFVYEVKMIFNHMDIVNVIEKYVSLISVYDFKVLSKEDIQKEGMYTKFFPRIGKFRLEGNIKTTDNYFVLKETRLLKLLFSIYKKDFLTQDTFSTIDYYFIVLEQLKDLNLRKVVVDFLNKIKIQILNKYSLEELNYSIECLVKVKSVSEITKTFESVKKLLETSKLNREKINRLGLNDKFMKVINKNTGEIQTNEDKEFNDIIAKANEQFYKIYKA